MPQKIRTGQCALRQHVGLDIAVLEGDVALGVAAQDVAHRITLRYRQRVRYSSSSWPSPTALQRATQPAGKLGGRLRPPALVAASTLAQKTVANAACRLNIAPSSCGGEHQPSAAGRTAQGLTTVANTFCTTSQRPSIFSKLR